MGTNMTPHRIKNQHVQEFVAVRDGTDRWRDMQRFSEDRIFPNGRPVRPGRSSDAITVGTHQSGWKSFLRHQMSDYFSRRFNCLMRPRADAASVPVIDVVNTPVVSVVRQGQTLPT